MCLCANIASCHLLVFSQIMQTHVTVFSGNSTSNDPSVSSLNLQMIRSSGIYHTLYLILNAFVHGHFKDENIQVHHCIDFGRTSSSCTVTQWRQSKQTHKNQTLSSQDTSCVGWLAIISCCWWSIKSQKTNEWHFDIWKNGFICNVSNLVCQNVREKWMDRWVNGSW